MYLLLLIGLLSTVQGLPAEERGLVDSLVQIGGQIVDLASLSINYLLDMCRPNDGSVCNHPDSGTGFYYVGEVSLQSWASSGSLCWLSSSLPSGKREVDEDESIYEPNHSVLFYRGVIYEWGMRDNNAADKGTWEGVRPVGDCSVQWKSSSGYSFCSIDEVYQFSRGYKDRYGEYSVRTNNCHHYVNRMMAYLWSDCSTYPP
ncbi:uncharacterized protein LOC144861492 [Branchiostoma floridae x Branchiostoma japonicum]